MSRRQRKTKRVRPPRRRSAGEPTRPGGSGGFTLLEVMIAVAVLSAGVVPLLVVHAATVNNLRRAREMTRAGFLARDRLATLETLGFDALASEAGSSGAALPSDRDDEVPVFLAVEEKTENVEDFLIEADVAVRPKFKAPAGEKDRAGIQLGSYIASLYFEPEEEETAEE
ncbi:MAG: prepilin-type N-terminal cleavage/methylation domain-containing protein [PVC group bacterium]